MNSPVDTARAPAAHEPAADWPPYREPPAELRATFAEISLYELGRWLLAHVRVIALWSFLGFVVCAGIAFRRTRTYTSTTSFLPQAGNGSSSRLNGLAAQFGLNLGSEPSRSPAFYEDILKSDALLGLVADAKYARVVGGRVDSVPLATVLGIAGGTPGQQRERAIRALQARMNVTTGRETGIVRVKLSAASPELAQQLTTRLVETMNAFNLAMRQEQAVAERVFARERFEETLGELRTAEDRLQDFLRQNRLYTNSPDLRAQNERLQREVQMRQQIYMTLAQAYEQARIESVRGTPVINVLERPSLPANPDGRGTVKFGLVGLILGAMAGVGYALARERRTRARAE